MGQVVVLAAIKEVRKELESACQSDKTPVEVSEIVLRLGSLYSLLNIDKLIETESLNKAA